MIVRPRWGTSLVAFQKDKFVCSAAAERGRCISCSVGLFFSSMVFL